MTPEEKRLKAAGKLDPFQGSSLDEINRMLKARGFKTFTESQVKSEKTLVSQ